MLVFDLFTILQRKWARRGDAKQQQKWRQYFLSVITAKGQGAAAAPALLVVAPWYLRPALKRREESQRLLLLLWRLDHLLAFQEALTPLLEQKKYQTALLKWLQNQKTVFARLAGRYFKQESAVRAFYAYLLRQYQLGSPSLADPIVQALLLQVADDSLYCRENALQALYSFGGVEPVVQGLLRLSRSGVEHNAKLVTDGLLAFTGQQQLLNTTLWQNWNQFTPFYQTAIVNYLRFNDNRFCQRLLPLLQNPQTDLELRLAIIRYYRRYPYAPVRELLQGWLKNDGVGWEFAAVSASALESYPGADTETALQQALRHRNWYVHNNAAESLLALRAKIVGVPGTLASQGWYLRPYQDGKWWAVAPDDPVLAAILQGNDRYARDILRYKLEAFGQA